MKRIVFATNNQHKLQEIRDILGSGYEVGQIPQMFFAKMFQIPQMFDP